MTQRVISTDIFSDLAVVRTHDCGTSAALYDVFRVLFL